MIYMPRLMLFLLASFVMSACGGHQSNQPIIENPYAQHMKDFTHAGVEAMHQGHWSSAEFAFKRALRMAQLTNDPVMMTHSWYNLSMVYKAMSQTSKQEESLQKVLALAQQHHLFIDYKRAELQLSLLHIKQGQTVEPLEKLTLKWPVDIYLMAAKLTSLQGNDVQSLEIYKQALKVAANDRSGLLAQSKALLGLALLSKKLDNQGAAHKYALNALTICKTIGAPRLSAHASLLLASLESEVSLSQRLDYANRANDIYQILQDSNGQKKAALLLKDLHEQS